MTTGMALSLVLLAVLAASLLFIIQAEGGFGEIPRLLERAGIPADIVPGN